MTSQYPGGAIIEEQGLRDGFQSEKKVAPPETKIDIVRKLINAGVKRIQVASFVHPKKVPQMADAETVCRMLPPSADVLFSGLVLNVKGVQRAADAGLKHIAASISASDTHSRKNANLPLSEARQRFADMVRSAKEHGLAVRGGLQCAFGCRFEGAVDPDLVVDLVREQLDLGIDEVALADSTGMGHPRAMEEICGRVLELTDDRPLFLHLHDTEGKGLANVVAALGVGVRHFDTAFGGMGGCPFIKGASGNISTEDLVFMLGQMRIATGVDVDRVAEISRSLETFFNKRFSGKMHRILDRDDVVLAR
jgi:hydroxymethylglutaryl-CoA lyase